MTNLIFGGCDSVGKTSIINEIVKLESKYTITKRNAPKDKELARQQYIQDVDFLNSHDNIIFDRSMFCECVYAPIFRGYFPDYMRELETKLSYNNVLILVTARPEIVQKRFDGVFIKSEQIPKILKDFETQFILCKYAKKIKINSSYFTPQQLAKNVLLKTGEYDGNQTL